jgi:hypothetical protein
VSLPKRNGRPHELFTSGLHIQEATEQLDRFRGYFADASFRSDLGLLSQAFSQHLLKTKRNRIAMEVQFLGQRDRFLCLFGKALGYNGQVDSF